VSSSRPGSAFRRQPFGKDIMVMVHHDEAGHPGRHREIVTARNRRSQLRSQARHDLLGGKAARFSDLSERDPG
jgi:hypothetical protein